MNSKLSYPRNMAGILEENRFWLHILTDHLDFIYDDLGKEESQLIQETKRLYSIGMALRQAVEQNVDVIPEVVQFGQAVGQLKSTILARQLNGNIKIETAPTLISHMIKELDEYMVILNHFQQTGQLPTVNVLDEHELWQSDIVGHLDFIATHLDSVEHDLRKRVKTHKKKFRNLYMKTIEFIGYVRAGVRSLPELAKLTNDSIENVEAYLRLVQEIAELKQSNLIVGPLPTKILDHFVREELYYLNKLNQAPQVGHVTGLTATLTGLELPRSAPLPPNTLPTIIPPVRGSPGESPLSHLRSGNSSPTTSPRA